MFRLDAPVARDLGLPDVQNRATSGLDRKTDQKRSGDRLAGSCPRLVVDCAACRRATPVGRQVRDGGPLSSTGPAIPSLHVARDVDDHAKSIVTVTSDRAGASKKRTGRTLSG